VLGRLGARPQQPRASRLGAVHRRPGLRFDVQPLGTLSAVASYAPVLGRDRFQQRGRRGRVPGVEELVGARCIGLGTIGDVDSVRPLVDFLRDKGHTQRARAFAAVALGVVCDKEDLPWNVKLAVNSNYRANTATLTGEGGTGVLDIL
jgi:HEAT repeat protein